MPSRPIQGGRPHGRTPFGLTLAIAALVVVVGGCGIIIAAALWTALFRMEPPHPTIEQCRAMTDSGARLACYDQIAVPESQWPAKGAVAPLPHHAH